MPRALIFDKPGFVDFKISGKTNVFARQVLIPESFFVELEKKIIEKYGEQGKKILYSIGKKFGYSFAQLGRFENINDHPGNEVKSWITIASKFIEGTYASKIEQVIKLEDKQVEYRLVNFVICRKLGYDFLLATGGAAGVISWLLQDKEIEAFYHDSEFINGEHNCIVTCAPYDVLVANKKEPFREINLDGLKQDIEQYNKFNSEVRIRYTKSFSNYLDAGIFSYEKGIITFKSSNERFFLMEISGMYLLEIELKKKGFDSYIFETAFSVGMGIFGELIKDTQSVSELMSGLGWGEIITSANKKPVDIIINHFPWTNWYRDIDFLVLRGFLSGMLSKVYNREIRLEKPHIDIHNGYLTLIVGEER